MTPSAGSSFPFWSVFGGILASGLVTQFMSTSRPSATQKATAAATKLVKDEGVTLHCGENDTVTDRDHDNGDGIILQTRAGNKARPIMKRGQSNHPDATVHATISGTLPLRERCQSGASKYISVREP